jgi:hypothetical protein
MVPFNPHGSLLLFPFSLEFIAFFEIRILALVYLTRKNRLLIVGTSLISGHTAGDADRSSSGKEFIELET